LVRKTICLASIVKGDKHGSKHMGDDTL